MKYYLLLITLLVTFINTHAQTDIDGLIMKKKELCLGTSLANTSFTKYWEGTLKRNNLNLGTVSNTAIMPMCNYGITNKLNILAAIPYISTKASAGQLAGQRGMQDANVFVKYVPYTTQLYKGTLNTIVVVGASTPTTSYTPDLLPLSIGLQSKQLITRLMVDYQRGHWFGTASGSYIYRGNVTLSRATYYTTRMHYTNQVAMPTVTNVNIRGGYRSTQVIAEANLNRWVTNGGFDISRNNMPFVSNTMNSTTAGLHVKYLAKFVQGLSIDADALTTIAGRNVGQSSGVSVGVFYIFNFGKKFEKKIAN